MNRSEKNMVLRGQVFLDGRWVPISRKCESERQRIKKIEQGYVRYRGEWITIDEKIARTAPPAPAVTERQSSPIIINNYDNRTINNVDNRTVHRHEHRHVHVDPELLEEYGRSRLPAAARNEVPSVGDKRKAAKKLPPPGKRPPLPDRRDIGGLLEGPKDS